MIKSALTGKIIEQPIYKSTGNRSITSLSEIYNGPTEVYLDEEIGHLQTLEIESIDKYYDKEYKFFNQSDEDDVLYNVINGKEIFRQQHQVDTLALKIEMKPGMHILDYGCGKGTVLKRLLEKKYDIIPYLFDVSESYVHLWNKFVKPERYASYQTRPEWKAQFDLITSFFAFEHTPDPIKELNSIRDLLKKDGLIYIIVPNIFENKGDFIVADHIHHYSEISLRYIFAKSGFETLEIDTKSHFAAFIAICKKTSDEPISFELAQNTLADTISEYRLIANYWNTIQLKIKEFEFNLNDQKAAIYGAGVYGNFIATTIKDLSNIECFIDQNPLLHGKNMLGKPILHPEELSKDIKAIYIGLNPLIARQAIENIGSWENSNKTMLYL